MTTTDTQPVRRIASRDGTEVAYWTTGTGPPLVVVHGATADHTRWAPVLPYLAPHVTVHAIDRRGRGASGDGPSYDVAREYEDVAAVVDAVAHDTGSPVDLLGHSYGGLCALGGTALTANVRRLVLYEPPADREAAASVPPPVQRRMDDLLARGEREAVLVTFFREVVQMPDHEFSRYRALPAWRARVAAAHTLTRELRAVSERPFDPRWATTITAPTLMLLGGDSPAFVQADTATIAAALPDARVTVLAGQQHIAIDLVPQVFAEHVLAFVRGRARNQVGRSPRIAGSRAGAAWIDDDGGRRAAKVAGIRWSRRTQGGAAVTARERTGRRGSSGPPPHLRRPRRRHA